jgi:uncharacterized protein YbjT (DUF2867 family)
MRVLVVGGYGLIGGYVVAALAAEGHEVIGAGRDVAAAARRLRHARWVRADLATTSEDDWAPLLQGVDAVVNCAGALQDSPRDDLQAVHVTGLLALASAARRVGVDRLVQISAAGVAESPGGFGRTKRDAEMALEAAGVDWTILRPGLVIAPSAFGGSALLRGLAAFPWAIPVVYPGSLVQVVGAHDVALAVVAALKPDAPRRVAVDLASERAYRLDEILPALRAWLGLRPASVVSLPPALVGLGGMIADGLAWLGWRSPMRTTAIAQLRHGVRGDAASARRFEGARVRDLDAILAAQPSGVQDRWFARLYFVKPLGLASLVAFWLASGLIGLLRADQAAAVLAVAGFAPAVAKVAVLAGSAVDILLAGLVCLRRSAPLALKGMIMVSAAYLAGATLWRPDLWSDPLGPLVKVVPGAVLALALLGMMDER